MSMSLKRVLLLLLSAGMLVCFGGCSLFHPESELIAPPSDSADNQALRKAFQDACGEGVRYKSPVSGAYLSSFVVEDLDADGEKEAMVFYTKDMFASHICVALLEKRSGEWNYVQSVESGGTGIGSVEIRDLNSDGKNEILFFLENQDEKLLSIYACQDSPFGAQCVLEETPYSSLLLSDLNGDGSTEIFTVAVSAVTGPQAAMRRLTAGGVQRLDWRKLDREITSFGELFSQKQAQETVFYTDAVRTDGTMITQIICWNAQTDTLSVPFLDAQTRTMTQTARSADIACRDINGDGAPEIPCQSALPFSEIWRSGTKSTESFYQTDWCVFQDGALLPVRKTLLDTESGWMFTIPQSWENRFTICAYPADHKWNFYETGRYGTQQYLGSVMFDVQQSGYTPLCSDGAHSVYCCGINQTSALQVSTELLSQAFAHMAQ